jgi:predicted phosphodiesterase
MILGLLTDIHEHVEHLQTALDCFRKERVDQIVVIGDLFEQGQHIEETCRLLAEAKAVGVWGNHDFGLSFEPHPNVREKYPSSVLSYMGSLKPRLDIGGCHFTHIEPWLDPSNLADLWYFEGPPDRHGNLKRIFDATPHRIMFAGHYHQWLLANPKGIIDWAGDRPTRLEGSRYFVVIGALCYGHFATFDTETSVLVPMTI